MFKNYAEIEAIRQCNRKAVCAGICWAGYHVEAYRDDSRAFVEVRLNNQERFAEISLAAFDGLAAATHVWAYMDEARVEAAFCFLFDSFDYTLLRWQRKIKNSSTRLVEAESL